MNFLPPSSFSTRYTITDAQFTQAEKGYINLWGIDYSSSAIELSKTICADQNRDVHYQVKKNLRNISHILFFVFYFSVQISFIIYFVIYS